MPQSKTPLSNTDVRKVLDAIKGLRFGSLEITVHEGRIVQVERKEKTRLNISLKDLDPEASKGEGKP
ncbi:MAG TPA: DUF2292 domain-containing protein [Methylococcaceae bacterium]|nr:DUF2292 domain-containing protein [Methylococcaceae bacterium]